MKYSIFLNYSYFFVNNTWNEIGKFVKYDTNSKLMKNIIINN